MRLQRELIVLLEEYQRLLEQPKKSEQPTAYHAPLIANDHDASQLEEEVFRFTNDARQREGLSPLSWDDALAELARAHSEDMFDNNYFNHKDLSGCNSICRMTKSGYPWKKMGENIHRMIGYDMSTADTAQKIVNDWLNSPSHRANLLNPSFTKVGIGVAQEGSTIYTTSEYALPR